MYLHDNETYQERVGHWLIACFGEERAKSIRARNHRFLEESLELVQSTGLTREEAHQLVDYVFNREIGEPTQEVGGVMVTLAGVCMANNLDMLNNAETELSRVWSKIDIIREKDRNAPINSPLPQ